MAFSVSTRAWRPFSMAPLLAALALPVAVFAQAQPEEPADKTPYATLADILDDERARQRLVEDLRRLAAEQETDTAAAADAAPEVTLPERIAAASQAGAEQVVRQFEQAAAALASIGEGPGADWSALGRALVDLGGLVVATMLAFLVLRRLARPLFARLGAWVLRGSGGAELPRRAVAVVLAAAVDGAAILLAWVAGWALALFLLGERGVIDTPLSLFLNAFVAIETLKMLVRVVFAARDDGLRLLPVAAEEAAYWNAWLAHLASFVGYGALVVVPVVRTALSPALGQVVYVLVLALGFVYALAIILQNRARVRARLEALSHSAALTITRVTAAVLARVWHLAAIAYLLALTVVLLTRPQQALAFMATSTAQSLVAIALGVLLGAVIGRAIRRGIRIAEPTREKFPQLEERLNAFVPRGLQGIRLAIVALVVALVLDAWHLFDLGAWLVSDSGLGVVASVVSVLAILALAAAVWIVVASWIDHRLSPAAGQGEPSARRRTLLALLRNAVAVVIVTMAAMITLAEMGINIGPLLAGAGVLGLAIGFGSQKLVQDIIGGVFIQLENAINTGDWVTAGGISGTAERLSIRSVGLRDLSGTFHIVPFSSVETVSNYMRDFAYHLGEYGVAYREDTDEVVTHLIAAFEELRQDPDMEPEITGDLEIAGVTALADSSVNIRVRIMTRPGSQWKVGRAYNRLVKRHFDAAGIEIPFPHRTLYFGRDKDGAAPAASAGSSTDSFSGVGGDESGD